VLLAQATPAFAQSASEGGVIHVVQPGENLFRIGLRYGLSTQALAAASGIADANHIYVGQRLIIPTGATPGGTPGRTGQRTTIVQPGGNLYRVGLRFGVSALTIAAANGITNVNHIYAGQRLIIPGAAAR
jgi:LysM repeat protein